MVAAASNFLTPTAGVAWTMVGPGGSSDCTQNGAGFIRDLQGVLAARTTTGPDQRPAGGSLVRVDGKWGPETTRALWGRASALGAPQAALDAIEADASAHRVSRWGVQAATFVRAYLGNPAFRFDSVVIPAALTPPQWGVEPPRAANLAGSCSPIIGPALPGTPTPSASMPETPIPAPTGTPTTFPSPTSLPTGLPPLVHPPASTGVSWPAVAVAIAGIAVVTGLAYSLLSPAQAAAARVPARRTSRTTRRRSR